MPSQSGVHAEVRATVAVTLLAVLFCLGCSAASFDEPNGLGEIRIQSQPKTPNQSQLINRSLWLGRTWLDVGYLMRSWILRQLSA